MVAWTPPYSVVLSVTAPDMQMVVVPATSTKATTDIAKVNFTVLPRRTQDERVLFSWMDMVYAGLRVNMSFPAHG
jgi:hypothetical protein